MFGRHNRFNNRLEIERKVLHIINKKHNISIPLEGLTEASIQKWSSSQHIDIDLINLLYEISHLSLLHNDCSRDTFSEEEFDIKEGLDNKIKELESSIL